MDRKDSTGFNRPRTVCDDALPANSAASVYPTRERASLAGTITLTWVRETVLEDRNFLLCWKPELSILP
jgi:hypothetical protein